MSFCKNNFVFYILWIISLGTFVFLSYILLKNLKIKYANIFWIGLATIIVIILTIDIKLNLVVNKIKREGGTVVYAIIFDKHASFKSPNTIKYKYKIESILFKDQYYLKDFNYNKLRINDTILIVLPFNCVKNSIPFDYFPTPQEIERCKDGCLYKDGEIVGKAK
jgi:hypothetical protein